jgi:hypothetical protein
MEQPTAGSEITKPAPADRSLGRLAPKAHPRHHPQPPNIPEMTCALAALSSVEQVLIRWQVGK